jgi:hypothetical protein
MPVVEERTLVGRSASSGLIPVIVTILITIGEVSRPVISGTDYGYMIYESVPLLAPLTSLKRLHSSIAKG